MMTVAGREESLVNYLIHAYITKCLTYITVPVLINLLISF